jgi:hypothetical protein
MSHTLWVEELHLEAIAAGVVVVADVQGLVDVAHQMNHEA